MVATATIATWAIQAEDAPAAVGRLLANVVVYEGVFNKDGGSFQVAQDTGSNMQVKVGSGVAGDICVIEGDASVTQGLYVCRHADATVTLAVAAADATNDRVDRVIARVYDDDADSSGISYADIEIVEGTPAASPAAPALPNGAISLATIEVGASVTAITNADITDLREELKTRGELVETLYFTSSDTFTKADYPWLRKVRVKAVGGGGAGGGCPTTGAGQCAAGGGGGAGGYTEKTIAVGSLSASETITVGAGGAGSAGASGAAGGSSSFGAHCTATGGGGGGVSPGAVAGTFPSGGGGTNGTASGGDLNIPGGGGDVALVTYFTRRITPQGGASYFGGGGGASNGTGGGNGPSGTARGSGGGGGCNTESQATARAGGDGADGLVIVELYA